MFVSYTLSVAVSQPQQQHLSQLLHTVAAVTAKYNTVRTVITALSLEIWNFLFMSLKLALICFAHILSTHNAWLMPDISDIVISLSKIRDRDWSHTCHEICINNQCCPMHQHPGATFMLEGNSTGQHYWGTWRYIKQIKYIFCAAFVDFASVDVTVVSSLKRFKKSFSFVFYIL